MRRSRSRASVWLSRILALTGTASAAAGLVLLPAASHSLAVTGAAASSSPTTSSSTTTSPTTSPTAKPSPSRSTHPVRHRHGSERTVRGPRLLNPKTINLNTGAAKLYSRHSTVTVSQTRNLVNQQVHVSWTGVTTTPSEYLPYTAGSTLYPLMVAECRVARPTNIDQCYGSGQAGVAGGTLPHGPVNAVYSTSTSKQTGSVDIQILTSVQNQWLGCDAGHACSLVLVPVQGGNDLAPPYNCANHLYDSQGVATAQFAFSEIPAGAPNCSWRDRIVIPLHFAPTPDNCPIRNAAFKVIGSPMAQRAMQQWDAGLCAGADSLNLQYSSALAEPEAVQAVQSGLGDVALTTRPAASLTSGKRTYTYAPIAVSAVSFAYWVDNNGTGEPYTGLRLDQRLAAKLLTTSYNLSAVSCAPHTTKNCDVGVDGNPSDIFVDPEFKRLNPKIKDVFLGYATSPADVPIVQSGHSDMTWTVTRWIAANKDARAFLNGKPDPWGMRVNYYYDHIKYPTDAFLPQDPTSQAAHAYSPTFPLSLAVTDMVENWPPGTQDTKSGGTGLPGNYSRLSQEPVGQRALFAVLDNADTSAFLIDTAAIRNHAGRYVKPTDRSMRAALNSMVKPKHGIIQEVNPDSENKAEYPLTMVIYAMVPTSGISHTKADSIARWLRYLAGPGQHQGTGAGQLPAGYLPMTPRLRAETLTAADKVADQSGAKSSSSPSPSPSPSPSSSSPSTSPSPQTSITASPTPSAQFPTVTPKISMVAVHDPESAGVLRYALPVLLILGGLAALAGAGSLLAPNSGAVISALRRAFLPWRNP